MRSLGVLGLFGAALCALLVSGERDANACGGCFHPESTPAAPITESTVVSDHRMVFSLGAQQTVLWDQIRYNGRPSEFAWVLPVRPGTVVELSHDEWVSALDATSQPQIIQPPTRPTSFGGGGGGYDGDYEGSDRSSGCSCFGSSVASALADEGSPGSQSADGGAASPPEPPPVQVVSQQVVGPYETVIVRSDKPKALEQWLKDHGYAIPDSILPIIDAYTAQKLDFVALRLRPGEGIQAMRPVRIVSPGADPTLPLRMVAAGIGARVGVTLYVISEGRYRPQNFPEATIDDTKLLWNNAQARSNYQELSDAVAKTHGDRTWITEYADKPVTMGYSPAFQGTTLFDLYYNSCQNQNRPPPMSMNFDSGVPDASGDPDAGAGDPDAGDSDGGAPTDDGGAPTDDAGAPTSNIPASLCQTGNELCCDFDDLGVAVNSLHSQDVWLTRLRADLPASALGVDLVLEAHPSQTPVSNIHYAQQDPTVVAAAGGARISRSRDIQLGTGVMVMGTAFFVGRLLRRRRRLTDSRG